MILVMETSTIMIDYIKEKKEILLIQGFKFHDNELFNKKVFEVFKTNLPIYNTSIRKCKIKSG